MKKKKRYEDIAKYGLYFLKISYGLRHWNSHAVSHLVFQCDPRTVILVEINVANNVRIVQALLFFQATVIW